MDIYMVGDESLNNRQSIRGHFKRNFWAIYYGFKLT